MWGLEHDTLDITDHVMACYVITWITSFFYFIFLNRFLESKCLNESIREKDSLRVDRHACVNQQQWCQLPLNRSNNARLSEKNQFNLI